MLEANAMRSLTGPGSATSGPGASTRVDPKLVDGARQFEAMMLEQMLKPMHFGSSPDAAGDEGAGGANDTLSGFGTEAVARSLAAGNGFGLARQIVRQVTAEHVIRNPPGGGTKVQ